MLLQPNIVPEVVAQVKKTMSDAFREQAKAPLAYVEAFNQYNFLFRNEVSKLKGIV
jgi:hypothetical protein